MRSIEIKSPKADFILEYFCTFHEAQQFIINVYGLGIPAIIFNWFIIAYRYRMYRVFRFAVNVVINSYYLLLSFMPIISINVYEFRIMLLFIMSEYFIQEFVSMLYKSVTDF